MSVVPLQGSKGDRGVRGPRGRVGAGVSEQWDDRGGINYMFHSRHCEESTSRKTTC